MTTQTVGNIDRKTYIGSSDAAAILGVSPWRTALDVYLDKTSGPEPITPEKAAIFKRGHRLEPYILDMLEDEHGIHLLRFDDGKRSRRHLDTELPFLAAELDAETDDGKNVEAKSANFYGKGSWGEQYTDDVPIYYNAQAQHGMMVRGSQETIFPVLIGVDDFRLYHVKRDDEVITYLRQAEIEMWDRIQRLDAPPAKTVSDIERLFPWDHGSVIQASVEVRDAYLELKDLKKRLKLIESDIEEQESLIKLFLGEHQVLQFGADKLLTWKSQNTDRFDINTFRAAHPAIAKKYTKTSASRVLRLK